MRNLLVIDMLKLVLLFVLVSYSPSESADELTLEVDAGTGQRAISPYIYGMNSADDVEFYKSIKVPFDRMGGNAVTRYNWKNDMANHASDWFFENLPEDNDNPEDLPDGSQADKFVERDIEIGARTMITIPLIGWTPKDRERRCGFSVEKYGAQEKTDEYTPDCGNGVRTDGTLITDNDPTDTSVRINSTFIQEWIQHLTKKYGSAADGGVLFYEMDNEYDLWQSTHRDVRPENISGDDLIQLTLEYAAAVKEVDPSANVLGPVGWGYRSILLSGLDEASDDNVNPDKEAHGGLDFGQYYLEAMKEYEDKNNIRILDYFDNHIYPQQDGVWGDDVDEETQALRLRATRTLWDPTYVDESWIKYMGEPYSTVQYIPRMRKMIDDYYPGTKLAITEYNFGGTLTLNGALAQADVLGIFGREGVDLASNWRRWGPTNSSEPWAYAFRIYRNYDGKGSQFGETSVSAASSDQEKITIFASTRSDNKLIVVVINKDPSNAIDSSVNIEGFSPAESARVFTYSDADLTQIIESSAELSGNSLPYSFPAYSITLFEIPEAE